MEPSTKGVQRILWLVLGLGLVAAGIIAMNTWLHEQEIRKPSEHLADYGAVPAFKLTNENGVEITNDHFRNSIWVADLIFTQCPGSCPLMTSKFASLQKSLTKTPQVRLASFTVDPKNDTPDALKKYAAGYQADTTHWDFLTGARSQIFTLAKSGFHLPLDSVGGDQGSPITHSERFVLVDMVGHIRGYFDGGSDEVQPKLLTAIGDLMREEKD